MAFRKYKTLHFVLIFLMGFPQTVSPQSNMETKLKPIHGHLGYKNRGNRYEGFYEKKCGGSLCVVSLLRGSLAFDWDPNVVLVINSPGKTENKINVRAVAIPLKTYYQMDGMLEPPNYTLKWPVKEVIYEANLRPHMIGIFGWVGHEGKTKFVPLNILPEGGKKVSNEEITLIVRSDVDVEQVVCRFSDVVMGRCSKSNTGWETIGRYVNAGHPIKIKIPEGNTEELCVEIRAKPQNSGTWLPLRIIILKG